MTPIRDLIARRPLSLVGDVAGMGAIVALLAAALHLPAIL